jgi:hypothetical protein
MGVDAGNDRHDAAARFALERAVACTNVDT